MLRMEIKTFGAYWFLATTLCRLIISAFILDSFRRTSENLTYIAAVRSGKGAETHSDVLQREHFLAIQIDIQVCT